MRNTHELTNVLSAYNRQRNRPINFQAIARFGGSVAQLDRASDMYARPKHGFKFSSDAFEPR